MFKYMMRLFFKNTAKHLLSGTWGDENDQLQSN